jgi:hypothetical protein
MVFRRLAEFPKPWGTRARCHPRGSRKKNSSVRNSSPALPLRRYCLTRRYRSRLFRHDLVRQTAQSLFLSEDGVNERLHTRESGSFRIVLCVTRWRVVQSDGAWIKPRAGPLRPALWNVALFNKRRGCLRRLPHWGDRLPSVPGARAPSAIRSADTPAGPAVPPGS